MILHLDGTIILGGIETFPFYKHPLTANAIISDPMKKKMLDGSRRNGYAGGSMLAEAHIYPIALAVFYLIGRDIAESHWDS